MAMGPERSKALHNFTMPRDLRWGNQRFLRCMKVNSNGRISPIHRFAANGSCPSDQRNRGDSVQQPRAARGGGRGMEANVSSGSHRVDPAPPPASDGRRRFSDVDDGIAAMREKVMFDLQTEADKMKFAIFKDELQEGEVPASPTLPPEASVEGEAQRPWNLRSRRAACKTPASRFASSMNGGATASGETYCAGRTGLTVDVPESNSVLSKKKAGSGAVTEKPPELRSGSNSGPAAGDKTARPKFSVALSKSNIEEDYFVMVGHRPPRRPKKRAKIVQRELDTLFPGLWLAEVTPDMYRVSEEAQ